MKSTMIGACIALLGCGVAHAIPEGPTFPSAEWTLRETQNYARITEAPLEQALDPVFLLRLQLQSVANIGDWTRRGLSDPSWLLLPSGNTPVTPLCTTWAEQCAGDPFRYPGFDGPDGRSFYDTEAEVIPVVIYDRDCARLSGRVWAPRNGRNDLPAVVIENGSIQAPETLYWWAAQALVRAGYVVMTFDPRGQGRSDQQSPRAQQGSNINPAVFWEGLVDVIDFFRSSSVQPYPHNLSCAGTYATDVTAFNPLIERIDLDRLGLAGHSLGAVGVSVVQSYGAPGAEPWPGLLDADNPVDVIVAWDDLTTPRDAGTGGPAVVPRVPAMGQTSEYRFLGPAFLTPPDPEAHKNAFAGWRDAGLPTFQLTIQGSSHFEWSPIPTFPASSWCADTASRHCTGGWGLPLAEHYTIAWFDRWLKRPGEPGYDDADARLLADDDWVDRYSFYSRSARAFPDRNGGMRRCEDIRAGCEDLDIGVPSKGGGALGWITRAAGLALGWRSRRRA